jgi:hypothetical protein
MSAAAELAECEESLCADGLDSKHDVTFKDFNTWAKKNHSDSGGQNGRLVTKCNAHKSELFARNDPVGSRMPLQCSAKNGTAPRGSHRSTVEQRQ